MDSLVDSVVDLSDLACRCIDELSRDALLLTFCRLAFPFSLTGVVLMGLNLASSSSTRWVDLKADGTTRSDIKDDFEAFNFKC